MAAAVSLALFSSLHGASAFSSTAHWRSSSKASISKQASEMFGGTASLAVKRAATAPRSAEGPSGATAVRAAKKDEELNEIRGMSTPDIEQAVFDLKGELFLLRARQATRLEYKPSEFGRIRKRVARMLTVRREREIEEGVAKRESRKLEREWRKNVVPRPPPSYNPDDWKK